MPLRCDIPKEVEIRIRKRDKLCVYCHRAMKLHPHTRGMPTDKATMEHFDEDGGVYWGEKGLNESGLGICCGSCNASRGAKSLGVWFKGEYCIQQKINKKTVLGPVKKFIRTHKYKV